MNRFKKSIAWIVLSTFLTALPCIGRAEETDVDDDGEGDYVEMKADEQAPFDGFLLHKNAMIKLVTERESEIGRIKISFETTKKKLELDLETLTKKKDIELQINKDMYEQILKIKQDRIDQLSSAQKWSDAKLIGGFVLGFAASVAIFYAAVQVAK
jgi:hypothetical protein